MGKHHGQNSMVQGCGEGQFAHVSRCPIMALMWKTGRSVSRVLSEVVAEREERKVLSPLPDVPIKPFFFYPLSPSFIMKSSYILLSTRWENFGDHFPNSHDLHDLYMCFNALTWWGEIWYWTLLLSVTPVYSCFSAEGASIDELSSTKHPKTSLWTHTERKDLSATTQ